ncbi:histone acetyltransferase KAT7 [Euwallacea fornicatus]|uniref:histone acetyltransferase KAT7 n=1 Tax=Euwallacea fornicatus TaxID=995702 RepID=UPI00338F0DBC
MTGKKKNGSSTESSSETTSGSSSSTSSSSGSDSSSSSDSDSSSSQNSSKNSGSESPKKTAAVQKTLRKSTENPKPGTTTKLEPKPTNRSKVHSVKVPIKQVPSISSTDEEDDKQISKQVKRKSNVKPKSSATIILKQTASSSSLLAKSAFQKQAALRVVPSVKQASKVKEPVKKNAAKTVDSKKKSIFSPENSSESDSPKSVVKVPSKSTIQVKPKPEPRPKAAAKPVERPRVDRRIPEKRVPEIKTSQNSSASSGTSTSGSSSSSSGSESSGDDSEKDKKAIKKSAKKVGANVNENADGSESEVETGKSKQFTRKLTRSSSTRKSKHVLGKTIDSDTDSDTESTKRSLSRSPVKRVPTATKGKSKNNKKADPKSKRNEVIIVERTCPLEGCDSVGHLSGKFDKHFVLEACPNYHNTTIPKCKVELVERRKREETRKKALEYIYKSPSSPTQEQKQYLARVKDLRNKFKQEPMDDIKPQIDKSKEPDLNNMVPEYDLKLFKDAQALASEKIEEELKSLPSTKGTKCIEMGKYEMEVWYQSPYPEDYARLPKLYICEYCLRYMKSRTILERHVIKCVWRHPPGDEVYRKDKVSVWEVDGKKYKQYCQNLCLLAKFFLDHKTLYYDVEPFLFYIMTLVDNEGCHTVGYFSKEKNSFLNYNVSCILTLPPYQRQGYGRLLIDFSYLLTRVEGKIGSPEKPLSDLGLISYRSYWKDVLLNYLCSRAGTTLSVKDISQEMAIHSYDIVSTLQALGMMKYWKGKHIILKKQDVLDEYVERVQRRGSLLKEIDPDYLRWTPTQNQVSV